MLELARHAGSARVAAFLSYYQFRGGLSVSHPNKLIGSVPPINSLVLQFES